MPNVSPSSFLEQIRINRYEYSRSNRAKWSGPFLRCLVRKHMKSVDFAIAHKGALVQEGHSTNDALLCMYVYETMRNL